MGLSLLTCNPLILSLVLLCIDSPFKGATAIGTNAAVPAYIDEYPPFGILLQSIPMPTIKVNNNFQFTVPGSGLDGDLTW